MNILTQFLDKSLAVSRLGKEWMSALCADLFSAGRTISYVETVSNKADSVHKAIKQTDELTLKKSYELTLRKLLKQFGLKEVELAIDGTKEPYYGKELLHTRGSKRERGTNQVWEYIQEF